LVKQYFKRWSTNLQGELRKLRKELQEELIVLENLEEGKCLSSEQWHRKTWIIYENLRFLNKKSYIGTTDPMKHGC
jgi:hypothetical protein